MPYTQEQASCIAICGISAGNKPSIRIQKKRPHIAACITGKVRTYTQPLHHKTNTLYYIEQKNVTRNGTLKSTKKP